MSATKIIKRYANRKLYDTVVSCYVTLDDIATMIRRGENVRVIDNKTNDDLTTVTLAQIIFETEKKNNFMPLALLRRLIQGGSEAIGELGDWAREGVDRVQAKAHDLKESAQKLTQEMSHRLGWSELVAAPLRTFDELRLAFKERKEGLLNTAQPQRSSGVSPEMSSGISPGISGVAVDLSSEGYAPGHASGHLPEDSILQLDREMDDIRQRLVELEKRLTGFTQE